MLINPPVPSRKRQLQPQTSEDYRLGKGARLGKQLCFQLAFQFELSPLTEREVLTPRGRKGWW